LEERKKKQKRKKMYSVNRFVDEQEYNKSVKNKGGVESTSGTTKLMAISSQEGGRIENLEDRWERSLPEFLKFSNGAAARKVGLRL